MLGFLQVIPPELQQMQNNISEILRFVPSIDSLVSDIQQVKNVVLQLQQHNNGRLLLFSFLGCARVYWQKLVLYIASWLDVIQKWLSPLEPQKRHHDIKSTRINGTGEWVLETEAYKAWIKQGSRTGTLRDRILSFYGMPGAGKTFIA